MSNDLSGYDKSKYKVSIVASASSRGKAFQLGEPITVKWEAPHKHSRKDWIGLYRVCITSFVSGVIIKRREFSFHLGWSE